MNAANAANVVSTPNIASVAATPLLPVNTADSVTRIEVKISVATKRTYQPKKIPRKREHGFLKRMSTGVVATF